VGMEWEMPIRLLLSGVFGGIIGYQRESHHKSAGLRTHILVSIGSCLIMLLSTKIYSDVQGLTNADPARLAAQVVSGIGFLGAGSIIKEGPTVTGLTTAASLWVVSGVGLAIGVGYYTGALLTTALVFLTLTILSRVEHKEYGQLATLIVTTSKIAGQASQIGGLLGKYHVNIKNVKVDEREGQSIITLLVYGLGHMQYNDITIQILELPGIKSVEID